jgi:hypothetical protein
VPPAANGTTKVIGFVGHSCAPAKPHANKTRAQARPAIFRFLTDISFLHPSNAADGSIASMRVFGSMEKRRLAPDDQQPRSRRP